MVRDESEVAIGWHKRENLVVLPSLVAHTWMKADVVEYARIGEA